MNDYLLLTNMLWCDYEHEARCHLLVRPCVIVIMHPNQNTQTNYIQMKFTGFL